MSERVHQLVLHYDGGGFAGWQRQPDVRTVQGVLEGALERLCESHIAVLGAGRTDAGVHARGQAAGVRVSERWSAAELRRAMNAVLPPDIWIASAHEMHERFHARYDATSRRYTYYLGTDEASRSPFRRRYEWALGRPVDAGLLHASAAALLGEHAFWAFAVRGTAPEEDAHRCTVMTSCWRERDGGYEFEIEANRFLHHMVRFLVGTMVDVARGRRPLEDVQRLLQATSNADTSPPAPAHALFLDAVIYPCDLYLDS